MKSKKLTVLLSALMAVSLFSGCGKTAGKSDELKIGAVVPLTGEVSTYGQSSKNALDILMEETNKNGGVLGKKIKFIYEDDEGKPPTSANAGQKLINNDKVVAIVGSLTSGCSNALAPVAVQNKIPMITGASTDPKVTEAGEYVFRACFIDPFQGTILAKFAAEDLKVKTAAILYDNGSDYSKGLAEYFNKDFEKLGGKVVASETYNKGDQDFNAQLTKIKGTNPDVILLPDYYGTVANIAKQARALGIKATFLGGDGWDSTKLFDIGKEAVEGAYFTNHYSSEDTSPDVVEFKKAYEERFKTAPDTFAVLSYDAGKILLKAIEKAGKTDGQSIKEALKNTNLKVLTGQISFDQNRNAIKSAVIIKVEGGKNKFFKKINP